MADVEAAFRLLLGRNIDSGTRQQWAHLLATTPVTTAQAASWLTSPSAFTGRLTPTSEVEVAGYQLIVPRGDANIGEVILATGEYEPRVCAVLDAVLKPGETFVDVGANIGYLTLVGAARVGPTGRVVAIEASPFNVHHLAGTLHRNNLSQVSLLPVAASDAVGILRLDAGASNAKVAQAADFDPHAAWVPAHPLDQLLAHLDRLDVLKVDVEGHEAAVLAGARAILARFSPVILLELSPALLKAAGSSAAAVVAVLSPGDCNAIFEIDPHGPLVRHENAASVLERAALAVASSPDAHLDILVVGRQRLATLDLGAL
jgi:FkbM family methyltransferase